MWTYNIQQQQLNLFHTNQLAALTFERKAEHFFGLEGVGTGVICFFNGDAPTCHKLLPFWIKATSKFLQGFFQFEGNIGEGLLLHI